MDAGGIVRHALEVLAEGPEVEEERRRNRAFAEAHFADPTLATAFTADLAGELAAWRARNPA